MKRALILGTNAGQADIINYLKENKWEVHSCGHKKEGPGCYLADFFHQVDTINGDAVRELTKKIDADIVYSVSSDSAIRTATKVSEELDLPRLLNSKLINMFHYKDRIRHFMNVNNINSVKYQKVTSVDQAQDWDILPCVVKPSDSQGQRGLQLVNNKKDLIEALAFALEQSTSDTAVIEEYLEGIEISTNMVIQNSEILVNEFTERLVHGNEYFGLPRGHSIPMRNISEDNIREAINVVTDLVSKLSITDAVLYIQIKVTKNGPKIVEVAPRLDGCHIWRLIKYAKGYDLRQYAIDCLTGKKINHKPENMVNQDRFTLKFHQLPTGSVFDLNKISQPEGIAYNEYRYNEGEIIQPINGNLEVVGYYIKKD